MDDLTECLTPSNLYCGHRVLIPVDDNLATFR